MGQTIGIGRHHECLQQLYYRMCYEARPTITYSICLRFRFVRCENCRYQVGSRVVESLGLYVGCANSRKCMLDYVTTWGDSEAPTVLLLHPAGGTRHSWTPHAEALEDEYHVGAIDLPGHGIHPSGEFSFDRAVEDIGTVLEEVGSAVLVGHSQGGYVALRAAATHNDRVDGLFLAGADYNWRKPKMLAMTAVYYPLLYVFHALSYSDRASAWVEDRMVETDNPRQQPPDDEDTYDALHGNITSFRASVRQCTWEHVEAYDGPILLGHGESEPLQSHAETLADRAGADVEWYAGGHQAPMTHPEEFTDLLHDFLDSIFLQG